MARGLVGKTGPMTIGVLPRSLEGLLEYGRRRAFAGEVGEESGSRLGQEQGGAKRPGEGIAALCVRLHRWCLNVRSPCTGAMEHRF